MSLLEAKEESIERFKYRIGQSGVDGLTDALIDEFDFFYTQGFNDAKELYEKK